MRLCREEESGLPSTTSWDTWKPRRDSSIRERENCIPGFQQLASTWRPQGEWGRMIKSQVAGEEWAAVGSRRDRLDTKPSLPGNVTLVGMVGMGRKVGETDSAVGN